VAVSPVSVGLSGVELESRNAIDKNVMFLTVRCSFDPTFLFLHTKATGVLGEGGRWSFDPKPSGVCSLV